MRLHRLEVAAFGPFSGTEEIDFDALSDAGLFLIQGRTGAGKTSILDAVCFALYGQVPGVRNAVKGLRSDHAAPGAGPRVVLETTIRGRRLRVTRSPAWERPKLRGSGTTTEHAKVILEEFERGGWTGLTTRLDEAGDLISRLLGMNAAQFCQVALLPQGEFATFLRAGDDQRRELLSKLFGTRLYDRITDELDGRRAEAVKDIEAAQVDVRACVAAAAEAAGLPTEDAVALRDVPAGELTDGLDELAERLAAASTMVEAAATAAVRWIIERVLGARRAPEAWAWAAWRSRPSPRPVRTRRCPSR